MNRRDFMSKLALGIAVTPAAVRAATELAPVDSTYLCDMRWTTLREQLDACGRVADMSPGTQDIQQLFETLYSLKKERDSEPPRDYVDVIVPDRETGLKLLRMFESMRRV